jgi:hypothetical protein
VITANQLGVTSAFGGRYLGLLDAATEQLLREEAFADYGREWVASVVAVLRARIAAGGTADPAIAVVTPEINPRLLDDGTVERS